MTERSDHRFSATLSSPDLAVIGCMQALAKFSQETGNNVIPCEGTEEKDWRAAGQKVWPMAARPRNEASVMSSSRPCHAKVSAHLVVW